MNGLNLQYSIGSDVKPFLQYFDYQLKMGLLMVANLRRDK